MARLSDAAVQVWLAYAPAILRDPGTTDWERGFLAGMVARSRRTPGAQVSARQMAMLERIGEAFRDRRMRPAPGEVIE